MPTFQHAIGQGRASCGWGSPLFRVEDEGDGRNDVRVAHTRPIVAKEPVELPSGQMLPRRRDRASTRTCRSMGPSMGGAEGAHRGGGGATRSGPQLLSIASSGSPECRMRCAIAHF